MPHDRTSHPTRSTAQPPRLVATAILSLASLAALLVALSVRHRVAPPPPLATPDRLSDWWAAGEPIDLVAGVAGLAVAVILTYLALVGALATLAALAPGTKLPRVARACMPRILGAVVAGTVALTPTSMAAAADGPTPGGPPAPGAGATMRMIDPPRDDAGPRTSDAPASTVTRARPPSPVPPPQRTSSGPGCPGPMRRGQAALWAGSIPTPPSRSRHRRPIRPRRPMRRRRRLRAWTRRRSPRHEPTQPSCPRPRCATRSDLAITCGRSPSRWFWPRPVTGPTPPVPTDGSAGTGGC